MFNSREDWLLIYLLTALLTAYVLQRWLRKMVVDDKVRIEKKEQVNLIVTEWLHLTKSFWRRWRFLSQSRTNRVLRNQSYHCVVRKSSTSVPIPSHMNQMHVFICLFFNIHFNIVVPFTPKSSKRPTKWTHWQEPKKNINGKAWAGLDWKQLNYINHLKPTGYLMHQQFDIQQ